MPPPALRCPWSTARGSHSHPRLSLVGFPTPATNETPVTSYEPTETPVTSYDHVRAHSRMDAAEYLAHKHKHSLCVPHPLLPCVARRFVLLLATIAATGSTAIPPRSTSPVVWMGNSDDLEAVTADGSMSSDSGKDDEWNRRLLSHQGGKKGEGPPGKGKGGKGGKKGGPCGGKGKGKKGESCEPWECIDGKLNGKGEDYDGTVAQTASGKTCMLWSGIEDANGYKYANDEYGFTSAEKK